MSKTIAIFRTGGIGDVILSTVSINIIKDVLPDAKIIWFGREPTNSLIKTVFKDVEVFEISSSNTYSQNLQVIKNSANRIDAIIDLQHSARTIILGRLMAMRNGCSYTSWNKYSIERSLLVVQSHLRGRKLHFDFLKEELPNRFVAMSDCTKRALTKIQTNQLDYRNYTPCFNDLLTAKNNETVTICLGAKFLTKALPISKIESILQLITLNTQIKYINFIGEENQRKNADDLIKNFSSKVKFFNLCGSTTLVEAANILSKSKFAIVNDSGLAHLSEAVNTPVITFFGPTHSKFGYRPFLKNSRILSVELGCRPCNKNGDVKCRYEDNACSTLIDKNHLASLITEITNA